MNHTKNKTESVKHQGVFRRQLSLFEGIALIIGTTVGAGILGIPFVVARVGVTIGLIYIFSIGFIMLMFNLLVGELSVRTGKNMQMVGFAKHYLGAWAGALMTLVMYLSLFGALLVYVIGEGETLSAIFGGRPFVWSLVFFAVASIPVVLGLRGVKKVEVFIVISIIIALTIIAGISTPFLEYDHFTGFDITDIFLPYGVLLFAFAGSTAIPEVHSLLVRRDGLFRRVIIISGIIITALYAGFAFVVVGVTGPATTEIATLGLGERIGPALFVVGNIFAILAMATGFIMAAVALRDSLSWDFRIPYRYSTFLVLITPLLLFVAGVRGFIAMIDLIGGVFMSVQVLLFLLIYWRAKQIGDWRRSRFSFHHVSLLLFVLVLFFTVGGVLSVVRLF